MTLVAPPVVHLGTVWQGTDVPVTVTFTTRNLLADPPDPQVSIMPRGDPPGDAVAPTLTRIALGVYTFTLSLDEAAVWDGTVIGGWEAEEEPQPFSITVLPDPNHVHLAGP